MARLCQYNARIELTDWRGRFWIAIVEWISGESVRARADRRVIDDGAARSGTA